MIYNFIEILIITISFLLINLFYKKKNFLTDKPEYSKHKLEISRGIPLSGGSVIMIMLVYVSFVYKINYELIVICLAILILGIIADVKKNFSIKIRFLFQSIILILFIYLFDLKIPTLGNQYLDTILLNIFFNKIFVLFCLITLLNGLNFIDGLNGLSSGYLLLINLIFCLFINSNFILNENILNLNLILIKIYLVFFLFNIFGKCFFGDNGIYISLICNSLIFIQFFQLNYHLISPYLIASLLWYPAFENLFSILRRFKKRKKIIEPDNLHLHYLLMNYLKNIKFLKSKNKILYNSISGIFVNLLLLPGYIYSIIYYDNSKLLILNIFFYIIIYILIYVFLLKHSLNLNENNIS